MRTVLLATSNAGKVQEYRSLLGDLNVAIVTPADLGLSATVEESGESYEENAKLKASAYASVSGLVALADDSGLEVDALAGEPGVKSARFAGPEAADADNVKLLLTRLDGVPWAGRTAHFKCVIAVAGPESRLHLCRGECDGIITFEPRGEGGFGYDPVFYIAELGKTMAELPPTVKNRLSHRARAAQTARTILEKLAD